MKRTGILFGVVAISLAIFAATARSDRAPIVAADAEGAVEAAKPVAVLQDGQRLQPGDFQYLGAFRLPEGQDRPFTFAYGGAGMAFNPNGDPGGSDDGFPGSLFIVGHDRLPYGELPNGGQIAEVSIPAPVIARNPEALGRAGFTQPFSAAARGLFDAFDELIRVGMVVVNHPATGPKLHLTWGQHLEDGALEELPSHAFIETNLSAPDARGPWRLSGYSVYSTTGYMFEIPAAWADTYTGGRVIATGRYRDGGWSGQGPALFAYRPWDDAGNPLPPGAPLEATPLLLYESSQNTEDVINRSLQGYQHPDEWEGGAWVTTTTGRTAVLFAGTKSTGDKYWYGWANPQGPNQCCIETEFLGQFPLCRLADGSSCPPEDLTGCSGHNDYRGWWSTRWDAQIILYDPADLARVAMGQMQPWEPQPYAVLDIDDQLLNNPAGVEPEMLGTGVQRRYRIGDVAYDRANDLLYVLELFADEAQPVVHVWRVR